MDLKKEKLVRFYNDGKQNLELSWEKPWLEYKVQAAVNPEGKIGSADENRINLKIPSPGKFNRFNLKIPSLGKYKVFPENHEPWKKRILDPGSDVYLLWNRIFLSSCILALFVDPLFFYLPSEANDGESSCMTTDLNLEIVVTCLRTFTDIFYLLNILIKFRTAYVSPSSRVLGRGELVIDPGLIARRYLRSEFFIDLVATLPIPQIVIWFIVPAIGSSHADYTNNVVLVLIVLLQYFPRLYLIFPLSSQIIKAAGVVTKTAWAGAAYNFLLYILASHVSGAAWYLFSIERQATCWKSECNSDSLPVKCVQYLDCSTSNDDDRMKWVNTTSVFSNCNPTNGISFQFGIFIPAVQYNVSSTDFVEKYFFCLWWGLQNLSDYGQNLIVSTFKWETTFVILVSMLGLVLFAHLIGNIQKYLQSITVRLEEWRLKLRDIEEWMKHRQLPQNLRKRVLRFVQYKWLATRGADEESILQGLPIDQRRDIQRYLCLDLVRRVPFFSQMDDQLLDAICERLVSYLSIQGTYITREGDPVTQILFITRGRLESLTTNGGRAGFFNSNTLRPGDFCGEELLAWALLSTSTLNLPSSTRTVKALVEVEAFALRAEDLKFVANQFRRLHSKKLQHTFRFYSYHWRTWAACFIQAAWRRYKKRMLAMTPSLKECQSFNYNEQVNDEMGHEEEDHNVVTKLQKPQEPDFSVEANDD